jgi:hypothetical protein
VFSILENHLEDHLENTAGTIENGIFSIYRVENSLEGTIADSMETGFLARHRLHVGNEQMAK